MISLSVMYVKGQFDFKLLNVNGQSWTLRSYAISIGGVWNTCADIYWKYDESCFGNNGYVSSEI